VVWVLTLSVATHYDIGDICYVVDVFACGVDPTDRRRDSIAVEHIEDGRRMKFRCIVIEPMNDEDVNLR